ncbi:MAG: DotD/TraH family lipoprotein [Candidatus Contendobacter sp.]
MKSEKTARAASHRLLPNWVQVLFGAVAVTGCAAPPPPVAPLSEAETRLAAAAASVAESLAWLATVEQSAHRVHVQALTPAALPPELQVRVNVEYQGDLKPLVYQLARTVGYQVQTYGRSAVLAPVTIVAENRAVGDILADIGYQTSARCDVVVAPERRLVEIRYRREFPHRAPRRHPTDGGTG